ncbi:MAG: adenosylmethionine decarboxylase, partial [Symbiobacteriaceae bacterium]|nr:adenosylmethionine decarboxylase [Symbiobacteriaceae bacterium]
MKAMDIKRLRLHGFNNLTKSLSFSLYDICYTRTVDDRNAYIAYIDEVYNADRLTAILTNVANIIGAHILHIAKQDYDPIGASVTILVGEDPLKHKEDQVESPGPVPDEILAHLDKSHIAVHTYPEYHPDDGISTFRVDIDVSTCGHISPLKALNYLLQSFETDVVTIDYRVRGFTRDITGRKL